MVETPRSSLMSDRLARIAVLALIVVVGIYIGQPMFDRFFYSASTPRTITPRGALADIERTTIDLFERVSPSVVQVVGRAGSIESTDADNGGGGQSGTGFIWDGAGH